MMNQILSHHQPTLSKPILINRQSAQQPSKESIDKLLSDVMKQVKDELYNSTIEIEKSVDQNLYNSAEILYEDDYYKLVSILNYDNKLCEINRQDSNLILGSIEPFNLGQLDERISSTYFELGKKTYCLENDLLKEGALITNDDKMKHYAKCQKDDIIRSNTIGKVVQLYDKYLYFDIEGNKKTVGEYELTKVKKLNINTDPTIVRKKSLTQMNSVSRSLLTPTKTTSTSIASRTLTRRPSASNLMSPILSPRTIFKYRLVKFLSNLSI
jgi:hypothetical protein